MGEGRLTMLSSKWAQRTYIIHNFQGDKCQSDVPWEYKLTEYSLWVVHIKSDSSLGCHKKQVVTNSNSRYHPNLEQEWNTIQYNRKFQFYSPWWGKRKKKKNLDSVYQKSEVAITDREETFRWSLRKWLYSIFSARETVSTWKRYNLWSAIVDYKNKHNTVQKYISVTVSSLSSTHSLAADAYHHWLYTKLTH